MKKLFPLLLFAWACTSTPPESGERRNLPVDTTPAVTPSSEAAYQEVEDTTTPKFSSVYAFLDSVKPYCGKNIHQFATSWYAYTYHGNDYKGFQQFGVVFPFQYVIQDTIGAEKTLILSSVNDFAAFRRNQYPGLNAWGLENCGSPQGASALHQDQIDFDAFVLRSDGKGRKLHQQLLEQPLQIMLLDAEARFERSHFLQRLAAPFPHLRQDFGG